MSTRQHACIEISCEICDEPFTALEGFTHFDGIDGARAYQSNFDKDAHWLIADDGYALCPENDEAHNAARETRTAKQIADQQETPAPAKSPCPSCGGWGDRITQDPVDTRFDSVDECQRCDGTGEVDEAETAVNLVPADRAAWDAATADLEAASLDGDA